MATVYQGASFIGTSAEDISVTSLEVPTNILAGQTGTATVKVENTGNCGASISIQHNGSEISTEDIRAGSETFGTDFDFTVPSDVEGSYSVSVEVVRNSNVVASDSRSVSVETLSDRISIQSLTFEGDMAGGTVIDGTVSVQNNDSNERTVDLSIDGTNVGSTSVFSGSSRDIDFTYGLPVVESETNIDVLAEVKVSGELVSETTKSIRVRPISDFVSITSENLPDTAASGETIDGFDNTVTVDSDIGDLNVSLQRDGSEVGSKELFSSGTSDIQVSVTMPEVELEKDVDVVINGVVGSQQFDSITKTITVKGPASLVSIDTVNAPSEAISGDSVEVTSTIRNSGDDSVDVSIQHNGESTSTESIRGGRSSDITFTANLPEVEESTVITIDLEANVGGIVAGTDSVSITVDSLANKVSIQSSDAPTQLLSGGEGPVKANVFNDSDREVSIDLSVNGSVKTTQSVSSGSTRTFESTYVADTVDDRQNISVDISALVGGNVADTTTKTITVVNPKNFIDIASLDLPTSVTGGKSGEANVVLTNTHDSSIDANVEYDGNLVSSDAKTVRTSTDTTFEFVFETDAVEQQRSGHRSASYS